MSETNGEFLWYDLMTTDPKGAEAFYKHVVGWDTETQEVASMPYTMWKAGKNSIGGVMELPEEAQKAGAPAHWIGYVGTSDIGASFKKIQDSGGTGMMPPTEIPGIGHMAIAADPQGAVFAMFQGNDDPPPPEQGPGHFSWHELMSTDLDGALAFYLPLFGWKKIEAMDMGPAGIYQIYGRGERSLGGMMKKPEAMPGPPSWLYYVTVEDINATLEKAKAKGGTVINGPMEVPGGDMVAQVMDPQGAAFALHQRGSQD